MSPVLSSVAGDNRSASAVSSSLARDNSLASAVSSSSSDWTMRRCRFALRVAARSVTVNLP